MVTDSTCLVTNHVLHSFYGYDQGVFGNVIISEDFLETFGHPSANMQVLINLYVHNDVD